MKTFVFIAMMAIMSFCTTTVTGCVKCDRLCDYCDEPTERITETRNLSTFNEVKVSNCLNVNIVQSDQQSVEVNADESIIDKVKTEVNNGVLSVYVDEDWLR
ncbi:MAG: DUF2807 domain-containing protein, partial [Bacteroidales bacterium]|nr:DUF2807 domain-containing protein [Bacteroidales bacterium]